MQSYDRNSVTTRPKRTWPISRSRLTREIIGLKSEFADFKGEIKSDVADLRAEVKGEISTLIKWMVGVQIGGIAAIAAITTAVIAIAKVIGV